MPYQSAVVPDIQSLFFLDLQPSLMSLLMHFQVVHRDLFDPAGPLSSELSPSVIVEANETKNRGACIKFDEKMKISIGK